MKGPLDKKFTVIGKTEKQSNELNPAFKNVFKVDYYFEKEQIMKFEIVDANNVKKPELVGELVVTLA